MAPIERTCTCAVLREKYCAKDYEPIAAQAKHADDGEEGRKHDLNAHGLWRINLDGLD